MIYQVKGGVRIDGEEWVGASSYSDHSPHHSFIRVSFKNGAEVSLTEDFLRHALELIEHHRTIWTTKR